MEKKKKKSCKPVPTNIDEYNKVVETVKERVARWPSAYASGQVVTMYKKVMAKKHPDQDPYTSVHSKEALNDLERWFKERWIDINTGKPCGVVKSNTYYPTCRPTIKISRKTPMLASELSLSQRKRMVNQKQIATITTVRYNETMRSEKTSSKAKPKSKAKP